MWAALTALFVVLLIVIAGAVVYVGANLISFLQPILIPVAIAAILAYLLDPLVTELCRRKMRRGMAIAVIFASVFVALVGLIWWVHRPFRCRARTSPASFPVTLRRATASSTLSFNNRVVGGTVWPREIRIVGSGQFFA
jgi:predicted PurR-regulated permease PerM